MATRLAIISVSSEGESPDHMVDLRLEHYDHEDGYKRVLDSFVLMTGPYRFILVKARGLNRSIKDFYKPIINNVVKGDMLEVLRDDQEKEEEESGG